MFCANAFCDAVMCADVCFDLLYFSFCVDVCVQSLICYISHFVLMCSESDVLNLSHFVLKCSEFDLLYLSQFVLCVQS